MKMNEEELNRIHDHSGWHADAITRSRVCGCFYCLSTFPPSEIEEWIDEDPKCPRGAGRTAICPKCGIDSVLPDSEFFDLTSELLEEMNKHYF